MASVEQIQTESEPLLGGPGDALQQPNQSMLKNLYLGEYGSSPGRWCKRPKPKPRCLTLLTCPRPISGTGLLAQAGEHLAARPGLGSRFHEPAAAALLAPSALAVARHPHPAAGDPHSAADQHQPKDKVLGARAHASLNLLSFLLFTAGVAIIETNKERSHSPHFHSVHGYLGVTTAVVLLVQYIFGFLI